MSMRAAVLQQAAEPLAVVDVDDPVAAPGELVLSVDLRRLRVGPPPVRRLLPAGPGDGSRAVRPPHSKVLNSARVDSGFDPAQLPFDAELVLEGEEWLVGSFEIPNSSGGLAAEHGRMTTQEGTVVAESFQTRFAAQG